MFRVCEINASITENRIDVEIIEDNGKRYKIEALGDRVLIVNLQRNRIQGLKAFIGVVTQVALSGLLWKVVAPTHSVVSYNESGSAGAYHVAVLRGSEKMDTSGHTLSEGCADTLVPEP